MLNHQLPSCLCPIPGAQSPSIMVKGNNQKMANGSTPEFEAQLWAAAEQAVPAPRLQSEENVTARKYPAQRRKFLNRFTSRPQCRFHSRQCVGK
jgi:hypothetical protein